MILGPGVWTSWSACGENLDSELSLFQEKISVFYAVRRFRTAVSKSSSWIISTCNRNRQKVEKIGQSSFCRLSTNCLRSSFVNLDSFSQVWQNGKFFVISLHLDAVKTSKILNRRKKIKSFFSAFLQIMSPMW